mgnify:CR=1 FL=1
MFSSVTVWQGKATGNLIQDNNAGGTLGSGISLELSYDNDIVDNQVSGNGGEGVEVVDSAPAGQGNLIEGNTILMEREGTNVLVATAIANGQAREELTRLAEEQAALRPGEVAVTWLGYRIETSLLVAAFAVVAMSEITFPLRRANYALGVWLLIATRPRSTSRPRCRCIAGLFRFLI